MSVSCFTGVPGSGKSMDAARVLYRWLNGRSDCRVVANFPVDLSLVKHPERFIHVPNDDMNTRRLAEIAEDYFSSHDFRESSLLLVVDECQVLYNSRRWAQDKDRQTWLTFIRIWASIIIMLCAMKMTSYPNFLCWLVNVSHVWRSLSCAHRRELYST